jgi:hypothetical protein
MTHPLLANAMDRAVALDPVFGHVATDNPDLTAFKSRGGKMLTWHGYNDEAIPVQTTIHYYEATGTLRPTSELRNFKWSKSAGEKR